MVLCSPDMPWIKRPLDHWLNEPHQGLSHMAWLPCRLCLFRWWHSIPGLAVFRLSYLFPHPVLVRLTSWKTHISCSIKLFFFPMCSLWKLDTAGKKVGLPSCRCYILIIFVTLFCIIYISIMVFVMDNFLLQEHRIQTLQYNLPLS